MMAVMVSHPPSPSFAAATSMSCLASLTSCEQNGRLVMPVSHIHPVTFTMLNTVQHMSPQTLSAQPVDAWECSFDNGMTIATELVDFATVACAGLAFSCCQQGGFVASSKTA